MGQDCVLVSRGPPSHRKVETKDKSTHNVKIAIVLQTDMRMLYVVMIIGDTENEFYPNRDEGLSFFLF